jgi:hypothetical protein
MQTKGTAIEGPYTPSDKMLYFSSSNRGQRTCFAVEEKKLLNDSSFHHHSVGSDSYQKACNQVKQISLKFSFWAFTITYVKFK